MNLEEFYIGNDLDSPTLGHTTCSVEESIFILSKKVYKDMEHNDLVSMLNYTLQHKCPPERRFVANWFTGEDR